MKRIFIYVLFVCLVASAIGYILYRYKKYNAENWSYKASDNLQEINIISIQDLERQAQEIIEAGAFDYIAGGAETETTLRRNISAFDDIDIYPRVLQGVDSPDLQTSVLGIDISLPVIVAPAAAYGLAHESAEAGTARGAAESGTIMTISNYASSTLEEIAQAGDGAPQWFQLYLSKDDAFNRKIVREAEALGMRAIVLTVDAPVGGNRWRDAKNDFRFPLALPNVAPAGGQTKGQGIGAIFSSAQNDFSMNTVRYVKSWTRLPVIVKGIQHPDDAEEAINAGADAIWVSNHGGRQLDGGPASIEVLSEIAIRVNKRVPIIFDSGIRSGQHIFKAIASGADVVAIGRPVIYALALGGWQGVVSLFDYLKADLSRVMWLAGTQTVEDIKNADIRPKCMMVRCVE